MSRITRVILLDDFDGTEDATEVKFSVNGTEYGIDLSEANQVALQAALQPFIAKARTGRARRRQSRKTS